VQSIAKRSSQVAKKLFGLSHSRNISYTVSQKNCATTQKTFVHNFDNCWPFSKSFHSCTLQEICIKTCATVPTIP